MDALYVSLFRVLLRGRFRSFAILPFRFIGTFTFIDFISCELHWWRTAVYEQRTNTRYTCETIKTIVCVIFSAHFYLNVNGETMELQMASTDRKNNMEMKEKERRKFGSIWLDFFHWCLYSFVCGCGLNSIAAPQDT